ncbi:hypothetical protein [Enterobacter sp.]|uniref:hypothetical protein n=1 Tax=Enterobacter sp. TaxID=42895 RepID=UPI00296F1BC6|nr:hypothetical protein [Enterobacter sp.]
MPKSSSSSPVQESPFWLNVEARVRQMGLLIMLLIVVAATGGLFSKGYFSHHTRTAADGKVALEYERFGRLLSDAEIKIVARPAGDPVTTVVLGGDFMDDFDVQTLQPQPDKMYTLHNTLVLVYQHAGKPEGVTLWLSVNPLNAGTSHSWLSVNGGKPLPFWQFIYP